MLDRCGRTVGKAKALTDRLKLRELIKEHGMWVEAAQHIAKDHPQPADNQLIIVIWYNFGIRFRNCTFGHGPARSRVHATLPGG